MEGLGGDSLLEYFGGNDSPSGGAAENLARGICQGLPWGFPSRAHVACLESPGGEPSHVGGDAGSPSCRLQAPVPPACWCDHLICSRATLAILQAPAAC